MSSLDIILPRFCVYSVNSLTSIFVSQNTLFVNENRHKNSDNFLSLTDTDIVTFCRYAKSTPFGVLSVLFGGDLVGIQAASADNLDQLFGGL